MSGVSKICSFHSDFLVISQQRIWGGLKSYYLAGIFDDLVLNADELKMPFFCFIKKMRNSKFLYACFV